MQPEEFLDWVVAVEEILDFKGVLKDKWVSLVATKFRGRAGPWWQQLKQTWVWQGKLKITSWEKLLSKCSPLFCPTTTFGVCINGDKIGVKGRSLWTSI